MDDGQIKAIARKLKMPPVMWDTEGFRAHLARLINEVLINNLPPNTGAPLELLHAEVMAWRSRFPQFVYRPQDDCVALTGTDRSFYGHSHSKANRRP